jgi:hypothetical protein
MIDRFAEKSESFDVDYSSTGGRVRLALVLERHAASRTAAFVASGRSRP